MSDLDQSRYFRLSDHESRRVFHEQIIRQELARGVPQEQPVVVFVAGQPGAGTARTTASVKAELNQRGGAVAVNPDYYKGYHPDFNMLLAVDDRNADPYTSVDSRRWAAAAEQYLIDNRVDTVIETTMSDPREFLESAVRFREAGYRVEVAIMAVPEAQSRLDVVQRHHEQVQQQLGHGQLTALAEHDASYRGVLAAADMIDRHKVADVVSVLGRGNEQLAINYLDGVGEWRWPETSIAATVAAERERPWTAGETNSFGQTVTRLAQEMGPEWRPQLQDIVSRAIPRAQPQNQAAAPAAGAQSATVSRTTAAAQAFPTSTRHALDAASAQQGTSPDPSPAHPVNRPLHGPTQGNGPTR